MNTAVVTPNSLPNGEHIGRHLVNFVLIEPSHPGNVGSAARALQVMGFERLTVVNPRYPEVHRHRAAISFASGATRVLNDCRIVGSLDEAVAGARMVIAISAAGREFAPAAQSPRELARAAGEMLASHGAPADRGDEPVALVFGTERVGLSIEQAQRCNFLCSIDADPSYSSLNLAQALQIIAYEMRLALCREPAPVVPVPSKILSDDLPAQHRQVEGMISHLESSLEHIGYLDPDRPKRLMARLRQLFARAVLTTKEVDILRGICQKMSRMQAAPPPGTRDADPG